MGSQTSLKTSQRGGGGCNPLNPPPGSASGNVHFLNKLCEIESKYSFFEIITAYHLH